MELIKINLNLLTALQSLLSTQSVSKTAAELYITQPAVSNILNQLRELFEDELLIKQGRHMVLSAKAQSLIEPLNDIMRNLRGLFKQDVCFDPKKHKADITIAVSDYGEAILLPKFIKKINPYLNKTITLKLIPSSYQVMTDANDVDLFLGVVKSSNAFNSKTLFEESFVAISRKSYLKGVTKVTAAQYKKAQHVILHTGFAGDLFEEKTDKRNIVLSTYNMHGTLTVLSQNDYMMIVPKLTAKLLAPKWNLKVTPLGFNLKSLTVCMAWPKRLENDAINLWLRKLFIC